MTPSIIRDRLYQEFVGAVAGHLRKSLSPEIAQIIYLNLGGEYGVLSQETLEMLFRPGLSFSVGIPAAIGCEDSEMSLVLDYKDSLAEFATAKAWPNLKELLQKLYTLSGVRYIVVIGSDGVWVAQMLLDSEMTSTSDRFLFWQV